MQAEVARSASRPGAPRHLRHGLLLLRGATLALLLVGVWSFVVGPLLGRAAGQSEDLAAYLGAARSMAAGHSPYANFDANSSVTLAGFDYPPFAAVLVRPLALLSTTAAVDLWLWLSLALTVAAAFIVVRAALPQSWPRTELALLASFGFPPVTYNYWHGQVNPLIFLLLALAFDGWIKGREVRTGLLLGVAAGIKLSPIVLVVLLLRRRWWRGTAAMVAAGLASVAAAVPVIGTSGVRTFVQTVMPALAREIGWIYNQSLGGLFARVADHSVAVMQPDVALLHAAFLLAAVAVVVACAWVVRPGERRPEERAAEFGLGVLGMLLAASIAWFPHFTHLLIPLAAVGGLLAARGWEPERRLAGAALGALVGFGLVLPFEVSSQGLNALASQMGRPLWWPVLQLYSLPALAALGLFLALRRSLQRRMLA